MIFWLRDLWDQLGFSGTIALLALAGMIVGLVWLAAS